MYYNNNYLHGHYKLKYAQMKKLVLLLVFLVAGNTTFAQINCASAGLIVSNGVYSCGTINGTYSNPCYGGTTTSTGNGIKGNWFQYVPTANGELTVTSDYPSNPATTDTRLAIFKGTCNGLTCVDYNDDINSSQAAPNYRSTVVVPVVAGTTYYIEWDSYWSSASFVFQLTFATPTCIRPGRIGILNPRDYTTTAATIDWTNAIGNPASYELDWSTGMSNAAGTGTIVNIPAGNPTPYYTSAFLTGLPASQNFRYYVRSNCGGTRSGWVGPKYGYLAVIPPYSNGFENEANNYTDGFLGFSLGDTNATATPPIYGDGNTGKFMYTANSTTSVSNQWAWSRGIRLEVGQTVTITFKTRAYTTAAAASTMSLDVVLNGQQSSTNLDIWLATITENNRNGYTTRSVSYTADGSGTYFIGFHNISPIGTAGTLLFIDSLSITATPLGVNSFSANDVLIYPNPANNIISISNSLNTVFESIEMTDLNGRVVKSEKINAPEAQISISDLSVGVYLMKIKTGQGIATKKVIKE